MTDEEFRQEFRNVNAQFRSIDAQFRNIEARFENIRDYISEFRSEVIQRLDVIDHRLDFQGGTLSTLTKQALDADSTSTRMLRDIAELKRRVEKLESAA
jgi:septation ring formation regulator EzrA